MRGPHGYCRRESLCDYGTMICDYTGVTATLSQHMIAACCKPVEYKTMDGEGHDRVHLLCWAEEVTLIGGHHTVTTGTGGTADMGRGRHHKTLASQLI